MDLLIEETTDKTESQKNQMVSGENWITCGKTSQNRVRTNKLSLHMTAGQEIEPTPHWWGASALTTVSTLPYLLE